MENKGYTKLFRFKSLNRTKSNEAIPDLIFHFILPTACNLLKLRNLNRENGEWINLLEGKSGVLYDIPFILHFYCTSFFPLVIESSVHAIPSVLDCLSPSSVAFFALDRLGYTTWGKNGQQHIGQRFSEIIWPKVSFIFGQYFMANLNCFLWFRGIQSKNHQKFCPTKR